MKNLLAKDTSDRFIKSFLQNLSLLTVVIIGLHACAHPISEELRQSIDPDITFPKIIRSTQSYKNEYVILGGMITETRNLPGQTEIEVIQKELNTFGYPNSGDESGGRFIFVKDGFLDPEIFAKGRYITGAGKLEGDRTGKVDKQNYRYPVIEAQQLHLWEERTYQPYFGAYPYGGFYGGPFRYRMRLGLGYPYW